MSSPRQDSRGFTVVELVVVVIVVGILATIGFVATAPANDAAAVTAMERDLETFVNVELREYHRRQQFAPPEQVVNGSPMSLSAGVEVDSTALAPEADRVYLRLRHADSEQRCSADLSPVSANARNRIACFGGTGRDSAEGPTIDDPVPPEVPDTAGSGTRPEPPVTTPIVAPAVEDPADLTGQPGDLVARTFAVTNRSRVAREYRFMAESSSDAIVDPPVIAAEGQVIPAGATAGVEVRTRIAAAAPAGRSAAVSLQVVDAEDAVYAGRAAFSVTVLPVLLAPAVRGGDPVEVIPGETGEVSWEVCNRSNVARSYNIGAESRSPEISLVAVEGAGQLRIEGERCRGVVATVLLEGPSVAASERSVVVTATDRDSPGLAGSGDAVIRTALVLAAPEVVGGAPVEGIPAEDAELSWRVCNRSNAARTYTVLVAPPAGVTAVSSDGELSIDYNACVDAAAVVRVEPPSNAGTEQEVMLTATDAEAGTYSGRGATTVRTGLVLESPSWTALPPNQQWDMGDRRTLSYTFRNQSNGAREFCVEIVSADPARLAPASPESTCGLRVGPGEELSISHDLIAQDAANQVGVDAVVFDGQSPVYRAQDRFHNTIRDVRPIARWSSSAPAYVRRWISFDAGASSSPVGSPIVKYVWTWGLFGQQWDAAQARFISTGGLGTAQDELSSPVAQRAYDDLGSRQVCLRVVDGVGRSSEPSCGAVQLLRVTRARVAWRYRGWWTNQDWCMDVWWDNQCDAEHGNARWEIDLLPSLGDVPIAAAWATVRVKLHNTDDPNRPWTGAYGGMSSVSSPGIPAWGAYSFGSDWPAAAGPAQDGHWRVLDTRLSGGYGWPAGANLVSHPLVLNVNLAKATGAFDTGPHWVPDDVWVTLSVQDAYGAVTHASGYWDHQKSDWRGAYQVAFAAEDQPPSVSVSVDPVGAGKYRATGSAASVDGRVVDSWWDLTSSPLGQPGGSSSTWTVRGDIVDLAPEMCERLVATFVAKDDQGRLGSGSSSVEGSGGTRCEEIEVPT